MARTRTRRVENPRRRRRSNAWFQKLLEKGSETTYRRRPAREREFEAYSTPYSFGYRRRGKKGRRSEHGQDLEPVRYKGHVIRPVDGEWIAEDSRFESLAEAKRFLDHPLQRANRRGDGPPIRSTARDALHLYDQGVSTAYRWTAGLPSRLGHALLENPHRDQQFVEHLRTDGAAVRRVKSWMKRTEKELTDHRAWLRSKGYEDDGVAQKMEQNLEFWRTALQEAGRKVNPTPDELSESYEEHLGLTTSPEFLEADAEERAAMMTGMDMSEHREGCGCPRHNPVTYMLTVGKQMSLTPPHPAENFNLQGPFKFIPKYTPVHVQERGRGGHRFLVHGEYYSSPFWGWVEKDDLAKWDPGDPDLRNNPLKFGQSPFDRVPEKQARYHVQDQDGYIVAKYDHGYIAAEDAQERSEGHPGVFSVIDTRSGKVHDRFESGQEKKNPKRTSGRYLPPGTKVIINDNMRINAAATIVKWGQSRDQYGAPDTALVKMDRTGSLQEIPVWAIQPAEGDFPKGSSYRPNPEYLSTQEWRKDFYKQGYDAGRKDKGQQYPMFRDMNKVHEQGEFMADRAIEYHSARKSKRHDIIQAFVQGYSDGLTGRRSKHRTLKNPHRNPEAGADRMYEIFHGKPPDTDVIVEEEIHEHEHLATLGPLVSLKVETRSGYAVELGWEEGKDHAPYLACNEQGNQLYIVCGDQSIDLAGIHMDGAKWRKELMVIGDLVETTYQTQKDFDKFETIDYYHANGEESGEIPQLLYDPESKAEKGGKKGKMIIAGGKYRIEHDGIID